MTINGADINPLFLSYLVDKSATNIPASLPNPSYCTRDMSNTSCFIYCHFDRLPHRRCKRNCENLSKILCTFLHRDVRKNVHEKMYSHKSVHSIGSD